MNWLIVVSSITAAIATIVIALATWKYTAYSKRTLDEFKKQREFLIRSDKKKYELERRALCKRLLYEINSNEVSLIALLVFFESKPDNFSKIWNYFEKRNYRRKFIDDVYKRFIESNLDFNDNKIFDSINILYSNFEEITHHMNFVMSKDKSLRGPEVLELFISGTVNPIKGSLSIISNLYELFREEIGYDYRESESYKNNQRMIEFLEKRKLLVYK